MNRKRKGGNQGVNNLAAPMAQTGLYLTRRAFGEPFSEAYEQAAKELERLKQKQKIGTYTVKAFMIEPNPRIVLVKRNEVKSLRQIARYPLSNAYHAFEEVHILKEPLTVRLTNINQEKRGELTHFVGIPDIDSANEIFEHRSIFLTTLEKIIGVNDIEWPVYEPKIDIGAVCSDYVTARELEMALGSSATRTIAFRSASLNANEE
jgi:hypothetical protein